MALTGPSLRAELATCVEIGRQARRDERERREARSLQEVMPGVTVPTIADYEAAEQDSQT